MKQLTRLSLTTLALVCLGCLGLGLVACGPSGPAEPSATPSDQGSADEEYADSMAEEHSGDTTEASGATDGAPELQGEEVAYAQIDGQDVSGFLVRPAQAQPGNPALIVIHEWWGLNDNVRDMARKLAGEGYVALAVDLYRGRVAEDRDGARAIMSAAMENAGQLEDNLRQAYAYLETSVGAERIGSIGWCFGGGWSLQTALLHPDTLDAAVIYYGRLETDPDVLAPLEVPVLGLFGAEDGGIPVTMVREFEQALSGAGKDVEIHVYEGAGHAFANPTGNRYQAEAAEQAWAATTEFLSRHLKSQ